ncbi:MAG: hypothetical protein ACO3GP_09745 [Candidatus Limnocylindrus sp.]
MPFHKLSNGPLTMTVSGVRSAEGNFGPQMIFSGAEGTDVGISELSATKGLARLNLTPESVVGEVLTFEQVKKDGKTFTNINKGGSVTPSATAPATRTVSTAAPALSYEDAVALYAKCVDAAIQQLGGKCGDAEIPVDGSAIQAAAATLFITLKGR